MSQQTDIDTIRNGFAAFSRGDMETLRNAAVVEKKM